MYLIVHFRSELYPFSPQPYNTMCDNLLSHIVTKLVSSPVSSGLVSVSNNSYIFNVV